MTCEEVAASSAEFALGLLDGPPRATVVDHLERCAACRQHMDREVARVDRLLAAGPTVEPPAGFDARVLDRIAAEPRRPAAVVAEAAGASPGAVPWSPPRAAAPADNVLTAPPSWRRVGPRLALAAAAAAILLVVGIAVGGHQVRRPAPDVRTATMVTAEGRPVGQAVVTTQPGTLLVSAPAWARSGWRGGEVYVRLTLTGAPSRQVETTRLANGVWVAALPVDGSQVERVAMLDDRGWVVCEARLAA